MVAAATTRNACRGYGERDVLSHPMPPSRVVGSTQDYFAEECIHVRRLPLRIRMLIRPTRADGVAPYRVRLLGASAFVIAARHDTTPGKQRSDSSHRRNRSIRHRGATGGARRRPMHRPVWQSRLAAMRRDLQRRMRENRAGHHGQRLRVPHPDGSHDECVKVDDVMGKVVGGCQYFAPGVRDPDSFDH